MLNYLSYNTVIVLPQCLSLLTVNYCKNIKLLPHVQSLYSHCMVTISVKIVTSV